jgi:hypothetical protein
MNDKPAPLRFGLIVDRTGVSRWQRDVVRALRDGGDAELSLVIEAHDSTVRARGTKDLAWRIYNNRRVARRARAVATVTTWSDLAPDVARFRTEVTRRGRWSQHFSDAALATILDRELDFIVRFGLGIIRGGILDAARFGVWSFHHDDERVIRGGPPSFWEVYEGMPTSGVVLQRLTDRLDGGIPLARARFRSVLHSYPRNRDRTLLGSAGLPARVARSIRTGVLDIESLPVSTSDAPVRHNPTNHEMLTFLARQTRRAVGTRARRIARADLWAVGMVELPEALGIEAIEAIEPSAIRWIDERAGGGYFADPFPARRDGKFALLAEEFDEALGRGVISALERRDGRWQLHSNVLDVGVHASYPFLLEHEGNLYCVPEMASANRLDIWRCVQFPTDWERVGTLIDGAAIVDPTLFCDQGRWWLLGTIKDDEPDTKLHAWYSTHILGPWTAHQLNPVKIDVTSSRPAGTPFRIDGVLFRPAQDCSTAYGSAIVLNRVSALNEAGLVEETVARIAFRDGRYTTGAHTLAWRDGVCTVDGRRYAFNLHRMIRELLGRVRVLTTSAKEND